MRPGRVAQGVGAVGGNASFLGALRAAGPPYTTGESLTCFENFATRYRGPRNAAALRGALFECQDTGFLNTGTGLGYNTYANPFVCKPAYKQSVRQKYTGREFIVPNMTFSQLPSLVSIELDLGTPSERGFLKTGYCC